MKYRILPILISCLLFGACEEDDDDTSVLPPSNDNTTSEKLAIITDPALNLNSDQAILDFINTNQWSSSNSADNTSKRFILLEEFVGHKCIFCPIGSREVMRLEGIYKDQLIPVSIHAGSFAIPNASGSSYTTDFRVEGNHGESYLDQFNPGREYPRAIVSRSTTLATNKDRWEGEIDALAKDSPAVKLNLINYLAKSKDAIRVQIEIEWFKNLAETHHLQLFLIEDPVVDWQKDGTSDVSDYEHRNTLRKVINGTYGKELSTAVKGQKEKIEYLFSFDNGWKRENLKVVAFIFDNDTGTASNEVLQVNEVKVQ